MTAWVEALFPYVEVTEGVTIRVSVSFLPEQSNAASSRWFWAYHVRIENGREHAVQLLTRHWRISDGHGGVHRVDGEGVIGEQPLLQPGGAHDYVSGCPLNTPNGSMRGHFMFAGGDGNGATFEVRIPEFPLAMPAVET